jgi:two-component system, sensor histidine kinase and response regulator
MTATTPPAPPSTPALDPEIFAGLLELTDGEDDSFVLELFDSYVNTYARCTSGMREALAGDDADALRAHAHTLKGSSANVGAVHLAELAKELQQRGEEGRLDEVRAWIEAIEAEFERVLEAVRRRLPSFAQFA